VASPELGARAPGWDNGRSPLPPLPPGPLHHLLSHFLFLGSNQATRSPFVVYSSSSSVAPPSWGRYEEPHPYFLSLEGPHQCPPGAGQGDKLLDEPPAHTSSCCVACSILQKGIGCP
jgi:hypothetical protein